MTTIPGEDTYVTRVFEDYAAMFGAQIFDEFNQEDLASIDIDSMGQAHKFEIRDQEMLFIGPRKRTEAQKEALLDRINLVEAQYNNAESHKKVLYEDRLNRLTGNICLISIGGTIDTERQEINDKMVDGLNSVKNSMRYGVVPGGGAALLHASKILDFLELKNEEE